jgi:hypothetical protein
MYIPEWKLGRATSNHKGDRVKGGSKADLYNVKVSE